MHLINANRMPDKWWDFFVLITLGLRVRWNGPVFKRIIWMVHFEPVVHFKPYSFTFLFRVEREMPRALEVFVRLSDSLERACLI